MPATTRLNDDISADGLQRTIIAPDNPVTFKQLVPKLASIPKTEGLWYVNDDSAINSGYIRDHSGNDRHLVESSNYQRAIFTDHPTIHRAMFQKTNKQSYYRWFDASNGFSVDTGYTVHILMKVRLSQVATYEYYFYMADATTYDDICYPHTSSGDTRIRIEPIGEASATHLLSNTTVGEDPWTYNDWHLITFTFDGNKEFKHYVDGILQGTYTHANSVVFENVSWIDTFGWTSYNYGFTVETGMTHVLSRDQGAAEIKEYADTLLFNNPTGGEVKVWDTNNEDGLWDYLEFHAKLDEAEGTAVYDSSKHNRTVTETGWSSSDWFDSSYNKAAKGCYHFDGATDYFNVTLDGEGLEKHGWSIGTWFKRDTTAALAGIMELYDTTDNKNLRIYINSLDKICIYLNTDGTDGYWYINDVIDDTNWHFIVLTWTGDISDDPIIYIDGQSKSLIESQTPTGNVYDADCFCIGYVHLGNIYFDGYMDDCFVYSKVLSADRIKWLYENMPEMVIEQEWTNPDTGNTIGGWTRVYDPDHDFKGSMVIDNGLIRLDQYYRRRSVSSPHDSNEPRIIGYTNGNWLDSFEVYGGFHYTSSSSIFTNYLPFVIKELNKHKVVIETKVFDLESDVWITLETIINKNPFVLYKATDWKLPGNCYTYFGSIRGIRSSATTHGYDQGPRFCINTLDRVHDQEIATGNVSGARTEGLSVAFSKQQNILWLVFFDDSDGDWHSQWGGTTGYPITVVANSVAINFNSDSPPHYWAVGMIPFDTSILHVLGSADNWIDEYDTATVWANLGATVRSTIDWCYTTISGFPAGAYRAFFLLNASTATNGEIDCTGALATTTYSGSVSTSTSTWYSIDFIADENDTITFRFKEVGTTYINCGELVIIPISNSKNFPLDVRDQMLANMTINESIGN